MGLSGKTTVNGKLPSPSYLERRVLITAILDRFVPVLPRPGDWKEPVRT
jgi:hypothetical protein